LLHNLVALRRDVISGMLVSGEEPAVPRNVSASDELRNTAIPNGALQLEDPAICGLT
jgi:hypothetical protein